MTSESNSHQLTIEKLLLVEDNPGDARLIQEMLRESGAHWLDMVHVSRLEEALSCLAGEAFDVVVLDLSLPDSLGFDTFARVHAQAPELPIVVLTGLADEALGVEAVKGGSQDYLVKGQVNGNLLIRTLRYAVERQRAQQELRAHRDLLEELVQERTAELVLANDQLRREIAEREQAQDALRQAHDQLEQRVRDRTAELQRFVNLMAGREVRMAELKQAIRELRTQLKEAELTPVADDPLRVGLEE